jgi:hypothetical protein
MEKNISPKNKKEILEICQNNFFNYSTLTQILIIICVVISATAVALYLTEYIIPTIQDIIYDKIEGWNIVWRIFLAFVLYYVLKIINIICVSIGGTMLCREEGWNIEDFSKAWVGFYKYEKYLKDEKDEKDDEKNEK